VTFHNKDLNRLCLESVSARTEWPNTEVIVVDNGSTDGTPEMLRERQARHPQLRVLLNGENRGFAAAVNQGLAQASGEYLVLLNNDTVVARGWLSRLIGHLSADPALGLVGPRTNAISNEQKLDPGYSAIEEMPAFAARLAREHDRELFDLPMIAMFCVAMRRTVYETVGPLDERFAVGMFEDDDYCRRVRQQGLRIAVARDVYLHHWQRASFRLLGEQEYQRVFEENRRRYEEKWGAWVRPVGSAPPPEGRLKRQLGEVVARAAGKRGTVVFLPSIGWDIHLFQRPHHLARAFARRGWVAVFDCSNSSSDAVDGFKEIEPDLFLYRGPDGVLSRIPNALLWAFPYNFELADGYPSGTRSVYDWIDDLDVFPQSRELLERNHARGLAEATVVASVARRLNEQALAKRPDAIYLPNGVEYERFAEENPPRPNDPALEPLIARGAPIAGYYGALARWFDYDLLDSVAQRRPDWSFLLIGPNHDGSAKGQRVFRHGNVHWLGPRDYAALPGYLALFDVATIPFAINPITTATSPLKLFEYFAGAKPVVTTPMPECAAYPEVRVAANAEAFAAALDTARESGRDPAFRERLRQLGREGSWDARVEAALSALETASGAPTRQEAPVPAPAGAPEPPAATPSTPPPARETSLQEDEQEPESPAPPAPPPAAADHAPSGSNGLVGPPDPVDLPGPFGMHAIGGRCLVCGRDTDFVYDDPSAWREQLACLLCRTTSRYRSIARGLLEAIREITGIEAASLAELPRQKAGPPLAIYDTQLPFAHMASAYPVPDMLGRCSWIDLELSTWKRRKKLGRRLGPRTTNQNLERLTFADGSFDIVVTSDVMEHVRLEDRAHREIYRILRPGGFYVFTVPHLRDRETIVRVQITDPEDPSKDRHLLEPEYHGDANDSEGSVLAYRNFGIDLDRNLEALGFDVSYHRSDLERFGILGTELFLARRRAGSG
jgi:GT2 family glycosyltransferase/SAM-dependent methyltransferase